MVVDEHRVGFADSLAEPGGLVHQRGSGCGISPQNSECGAPREYEVVDLRVLQRRADLGDPFGDP